MKIREIWDRSHIAPKHKSVAVIDTDGHILIVEPDTVLIGSDPSGKRQYKETGNPYISDFFAYMKGEGQTLPLEKCYAYLHGLGNWQPIKKFNYNRSGV